MNKRYTRRKWNEDKEPKELDVYWKELTPEEQMSAMVLGWRKYNGRIYVSNRVCIDFAGSQ
jgi:hypothetical protein